MKSYSFGKSRISSIWDNIKHNKKSFVILAVIIASALIIISAIIVTVNRRDYNSSFLVTGDSIKIGIRTGVDGFGQIDENGDISGFDRDLIDEILKRMLNGQEKIIEYIPITSQNAGSSIKYGIVNICLGLLTDDTDRTKGFRLTEPYYYDHVVAVVNGNSRLESLTNMEGGKLGVFSAAISQDELENYLSKNHLEFDILRYSDFESALSDIENNRVNAVVLPYILARRFETAGYRILAQPLYEIGYSVMLPTGQAAFTNEMNKVIEEMKSDGTIDALLKKWNLA